MSLRMFHTNLYCKHSQARIGELAVFLCCLVSKVFLKEMYFLKGFHFFRDSPEEHTTSSKKEAYFVNSTPATLVLLRELKNPKPSTLSFICQKKSPKLKHQTTVNITQ